jgi:hypothetical protein
MKLYRKRGLTRMEPWNDQTDMQGVSISQEDRDKGSPKRGDMIAQSTTNPNDRWLISKIYFETNYEETD